MVGPRSEEHGTVDALLEGDRGVYESLNHSYRIRRGRSLCDNDFGLWQIRQACVGFCQRFIFQIPAPGRGGTPDCHKKEYWQYDRF